MKLVSSTPPTRHDHRHAPRRGTSTRLLLGKLFSVRTAYWLFVVIVAVFAVTIVRTFRHAIELAPQ